MGYNVIHEGSINTLVLNASDFVLDIGEALKVVEIVNIELEQFNGNASDLLNVTVTVINKNTNDVLFSKKFDGDALIVRIVSGVNYRVQAGALSGYFSGTLIHDYTSQFGVNRTVSFQYAKYGLYAYYQDGTIKDYDHATTSAIGVLLYTSKVRSVVDKIHLMGDGGTPFGWPYGNLPAKSLSDALNDFSGYENTMAIIAVNSASYSPAVMCRNRFNGNGYWPALGEMEELWQNRDEFDRFASKIGGYTMTYDSNQHKMSSTNNWYIQWYSHNMSNDENWDSWIVGSAFCEFRAFMKV